MDVFRRESGSGSRDTAPITEFPVAAKDLLADFGWYVCNFVVVENCVDFVQRGQDCLDFRKVDVSLVVAIPIGMLGQLLAILW